MSTGQIILVLLSVGLVILLIQFYPDLRRYLKMTAM